MSETLVPLLAIFAGTGNVGTHHEIGLGTITDFGVGYFMLTEAAACAYGTCSSMGRCI